MLSRSLKTALFSGRPSGLCLPTVIRNASKAQFSIASRAGLGSTARNLAKYRRNGSFSAAALAPRSLVGLRNLSLSAFSADPDARPLAVPVPPPSILAGALSSVSLTERLRYLLYTCIHLFADAPKGFGRFARKSQKEEEEEQKEEEEDVVKKREEDKDDKPEKEEEKEADETTDKTKSKTKESKKDKKLKEKEKKDKDEDEDEEEEDEEKDKKEEKKKEEKDEMPNFREWWDKMPKQRQRALLIFAALSALLLPSLFNAKEESQEIDWHDFKTNYLDPGLVDRLEVIKGAPDTEGGNDTWPMVVIHLKPGVYAADVDPHTDHARVDDHHNQQGQGQGQGQQAQGQQALHERPEPARQQYGFRPRKSTLHMRVGSVEMLNRQLESAQKAMGVPEKDWIKVHYRVERSNTWANVLASVIPTLLIIGFLGYQMKAATGGGKRGGGILGVGKHGATKIMPGDPKQTVRFKDVAGLDEAKMEVMEFVKFLKNPKKFTGLGAKIPKGALLVGPPGTGKTLLAKAMAGEAGVPFFSMSGSDFVEMFVGVGASRVRDLFTEARQSAPCIVWIDEIDAVAKQRASGQRAGYANDERENTLNQLLVEMDGFTASTNIVVLAGTNRMDVLDKALLRPGRFDRIISVDKPDLHGRAQIFRVHLRKIKTEHDRRDLAARLAALTPGMVGADIANICNEAAIIAARADKKLVELSDFERATDRVLAGMEKKTHSMSALERRLIAYHEAGHAVTGWFLEHSEPLLKVTIVARSSGVLGFAQYLPKELRLYQQDQLEDMMCMALGGRAAEQTFFGKISTGASDDLRKVTKIASDAITVYGMSPRLGLNNVSYVADEGQFQKPYSEETAKAIDEEVAAMVAIAYKRALAMVEKHKEQIKALAERLLAVETVGHDGLVEILGARPHASDAYTEWIKSIKDPLQKKGDKKKAQEKKRLEEEARVAQQELEKREREKREAAEQGSGATPQPA